jgi:UDP:flavonoid glycosyltransferase YjiC (YdhE family)
MYLGDVAPYLAVARRAAEAGHDAVVIAPEGFRDVVAGEPFEFRPYALDASPAAMHADPVHERLMRHPFRNAPRLGGYWMEIGFTRDPEAGLASLRHELRDADVVVTHPTFGSASIPVARSLGIPVVVGHLFPMMFPTGEWTPPIYTRAPNLSRPINRLAWWGLRRGSGAAMGDAVVNRVRAQLGQPPIVGAAGFTWLDADRTVHLSSRHYYGRTAADWPAAVEGGFALWEPPGELEPELLAFLESGPPPVLVTLGTSAATNAASAFRSMADGLDRLGHRSVLLTGRSVDVGDLGDRPGVVPFAPMTKVLPHCSVAVVSGALGGMAAAMAAGVPIVVTPQLFDQFWNGRRVEELGLGRLARRVRDVPRLVAEVAANSACQARATAFAGLIAGEDGPGTVLAAVDDLLR